MDEKRLAYLRTELRMTFIDEGIVFNENLLDKATSYILANYDVSDISVKDFDAFIDSDALRFVVETVSGQI